MSTANELLVSTHGPITVVTISRPTVHNALNSALIQQLAAEVRDRSEDGHTRAIVITGLGDKAFSAGADLNELATLDANAAYEVMRAGQTAFRLIERSRIPVIAAVNGIALGGGFELVLACSFSIVSRNASMGLPESGLGLIPGYGGTQRLQRRIGPSTARFVMLTGRRVDANRAYQIGLTPFPPTDPELLMPVALEVAEEIAHRGPVATETILGLVDQGYELALDAALALETHHAALAIGGNESTVGIQAFHDRQRPQFAALATTTTTSDDRRN